MFDKTSEFIESKDWRGLFEWLLTLREGRPYLDLSGEDFSGQDFSGLNFFGAVLERANLSGANLTGANLTDVNLSGANLTDAKFNPSPNMLDTIAGFRDVHGLEGQYWEYAVKYYRNPSKK
ncbi:MAG: pentapeptide repeat-containing protein [Patescibacteria group bacterium]|nr:pentapeptide repeat-containing protein [Patescibacteria group bacterium]